MTTPDQGPGGLPGDSPTAPNAQQATAATAGSAGSAGGGAGAQNRPPSLVPTSSLLILAAVLIVIVLVKPAMPSWLRITIGVLAVVVVLALLVLSVRLFRSATRPGGRS